MGNESINARLMNDAEIIEDLETLIIYKIKEINKTDKVESISAKLVQSAFKNNGIERIYP
jgi:hypothetical protein